MNNGYVANIRTYMYQIPFSIYSSYSCYLSVCSIDVWQRTFSQSVFFVCFYHVTYSFRVNLHCSSLEVKEVDAWNRRDIWNSSYCNEIRTHNHLVRKWTPNNLAKLAKQPFSHLAKWLSVRLRIKLLWVRFL